MKGEWGELREKGEGEGCWEKSVMIALKRRGERGELALVAILFIKCVTNHFSDMHGPILFKLGTSTANDGIHMHITLFCDLIKDGRMVGWRPF